MVISTTRFFQNNSELFSRLNEELKSLQSQAGSGEADLKLSKHYSEVSKLSAAEEMRAESSQYVENSRRAQSDLENLDLAFERLQDIVIRLQEVSVESSNDVLSSEERMGFLSEASMLKDELIEISNQSDSFGNTMFGGVSGSKYAFSMNGDGSVDYLGSAISKQLKVSSGLSVKQNFSGSDVFMNVRGENGQFSVFQLVDDLINSLKTDLNSGISSNLFHIRNSTVIEFPNTGGEGSASFTLSTENGDVEISSKIYGNDYSVLADKINAESGSTGVTATYSGKNRILLQGNVELLQLKRFEAENMVSDEVKLNILNPSTFNIEEKISTNHLNNSDISKRITEAFEHFSIKRAEVSSASRRAQDAENKNLEILVNLDNDIADIKEADLATLLTRIELMMTQKDAAQATFTRITSKSLFDFLG